MADEREGEDEGDISDLLQYSMREVHDELLASEEEGGANVSAQSSMSDLQQGRPLRASTPLQDQPEGGSAATAPTAQISRKRKPEEEEFPEGSRIKLQPKTPVARTSTTSGIAARKSPPVQPSPPPPPPVPEVAPTAEARKTSPLTPAKLPPPSTTGRTPPPSPVSPPTPPGAAKSKGGLGEATTVSKPQEQPPGSALTVQQQQPTLVRPREQQQRSEEQQPQPESAPPSPLKKDLGRVATKKGTKKPFPFPFALPRVKAKTGVKTPGNVAGRIFKPAHPYPAPVKVSEGIKKKWAELLIPRKGMTPAVVVTNTGAIPKTRVVEGAATATAAVVAPRLRRNAIVPSQFSDCNTSAGSAESRFCKSLSAYGATVDAVRVGEGRKTGVSKGEQDKVEFDTARPDKTRFHVVICSTELISPAT